jgi:hypothetical protein
MANFFSWLARGLFEANSLVTLLVMGTILGIFVWLWGQNVINSSVAKDWDRRQYLENIIHLQRKGYVRLERRFALYEKRCLVTEVERGFCPRKLHLPAGQIVEAAGWTTEGFVSWLAVRVLKNDVPISGYIFAPFHFSSTGQMDTEKGWWTEFDKEKVEKNQKAKYKKAVEREIRSVSFKSNIEAQRLRESGEFDRRYTTFPSRYMTWEENSNKPHWIFKKDVPRIKELHRAYLDDSVLEGLLISLGGPYSQRAKKPEVEVASDTGNEDGEVNQ